MRCYFFISVLFLILIKANGYKILFLSLFGSRSHKIAIDPVAEELGKRGHEVVFISGISERNKVANVTNIYVDEARQIMTGEKMNFFQQLKQKNTNFIEVLFESSVNMINATYSHHSIRDIIDNPRDTMTKSPRFDLVVMDASYADHCVSLAYHMKVPVVILSPSIMFPHIGWSLNIPIPLSYVPLGNLNFTSEMSFTQRLYNTYETMLFTYLMLNRVYPKYDSEIKKFIPNVPPVRELMKNVSFIMTNDHLAVSPSVPTTPYYVQVGGLHCKPAQKLPQGLETLMQSAGKHGVIYFSLGSYAKGSQMPSEMRRKLIAAFAQLPQTVIWKSEVAIEGLSENVKVIKWVPQGDLLAHPNLRLFITHFGGLSTQEAIYHGRPLLGFPLSVDQWGYMANAVHLGFAEFLDWTTFTTDELLHKIKLLLEDQRYEISAQKASGVFKDRDKHPAKTAAYWVEYIIRHDGAPHLKSGAEHLNFFQYFLLDIIGVIIAMIILALTMIVISFKKLFKVLKPYFNSTYTKQKMHLQ